MRRWTMFATAAFSLAGFPHRLEAVCNINHILDLPITLTSIGPIVDVRINDSKFRFLVFSGTPIGGISSLAVEAAGLKIGSHAPHDDIRDDSGHPAPNTVELTNFWIGQTLLPPITLLAGPVASTTDGYIGYELIGLTDTEYDLAHGLVRLSKPISCPGSEAAYWAEPSAVSIANMAPNAFPYVADLIVNLNGNKIIARISTTSTQSVVYTTSADRARLGIVRSGENQDRVSSLIIGTEQIKDMPVLVRNPKSNVGMLLGIDFLASHRILISIKPRLVYITKNN